MKSNLIYLEKKKEREKMKCALLIIDLQKAFYEGESKASMDQASIMINRVLEDFRAKALPVVWIQHIEEAEGVVPGTEGFEFIDSLKSMDGEYHFHKCYNNSFNKTGLYDLLREQEIDTVIITGYCAEYCVLSTFRGAMDLDLTPLLLKDSLASGVHENIGFVERINYVITLSELQSRLA